MSLQTGRFVKNAALILATSLLFACTGDDGPPGPQGETGAQGPQGEQGDQGAAGANGAVPASSAEQINIVVTKVTVADDPDTGTSNAATVEFTLLNDLTQGLFGMPETSVSFVLSQLSPAEAGSGASSEWQSYVTRDSAGIVDAQATTENGRFGSFTDNGDGTYSYRFEKGLNDYAAGPAYDANKTHRLGIEIRGQAPLANNGIYDFVPSAPGMDPTFTRNIVDNDTCNACHDVFGFHGGPRVDITYCVTCHNPSSIDGDTVDKPWGGTVDMKRMIHKIHHGIKLTNGYFIIGHNDTLHDYSHVVFPQDVRNCETCHDEDDPKTPEASNWYKVQNRDTCGSCHDDIDWANGGHGGLTFNDDTACAGCHGPDSTVNGGAVRVKVAHALLEQEAAKAFQFDVVSATMDAGRIVTASIRVLDPTDPNYEDDPQSTAYDINDPNGPFQLDGSRLRMDVAWTTAEIGNLDPNDDLARPADMNAPFGPIVINFQTGATNDGNNTFTKAASTAIPSGITGSGLVALEGRAVVPEFVDELPVASDFLAFSITDDPAKNRRSIVDINKCNDCHKNLALHGDNRSGNTEVCSTCHNPNATDINRRRPGSECDIGRPPGTDDPDDPGVIGLGLDDEAIDLKHMVHRIHAGNIGLCGFGNSSHPYFDVVYPGKLNNCEGCHKPNTYYPVEPGVLLATTIDAGADRSTLTDDVAISPNASVCSGCHTSDLAKVHMEQNGADFDADKDDTGAMISSGTETCSICHGPGNTADVKAVHGVGDFDFN